MNIEDYALFIGNKSIFCIFNVVHAEYLPYVSCFFVVISLCILFPVLFMYLNVNFHEMHSMSFLSNGLMVLSSISMYCFCNVVPHSFWLKF